MIKKVVSLMILVVLFFTYSVSFGLTYDRITENEAATYLVDNDIIRNHGTNWSDYRYFDELTRGEGLKIFMKISGKNVINKCDGVFSDLKSGWQCKYAEAALEAGFITKNNNFRPNDNFTKTEVAKLITKVKGIEKVQMTNNWQNDYMITLHEYGIIEDKYYDYHVYAKRGWIFVIATSTIKIEEKVEKTTKVVENISGTEDIIYYGYGNNSIQELKDKKSGDIIKIGTFSIGVKDFKEESLNLKLKYIENGISIDNMYLYDGLGTKIYGENTGNIGEIKFTNTRVGTMYGVYGILGDKLNINGEYIIELLSIDRENFKIERKNIGTVKILGENEDIKPELTIRDAGLDYFNPSNHESTTFSLTLDSNNNKFTDNAFLDSITIQIHDINTNGSVSLENLQTGKKYTISSIPSDGLLKFNMDGVLFKTKDRFQMKATAKGRFTIPEGGVKYHTDNNSIYSNKNWHQFGTNY